MVSIPACHAGDRGSIPRQREVFFITFDKEKFFFIIFSYFWLVNEYFGDWSQGMSKSITYNHPHFFYLVLSHRRIIFFQQRTFNVS